jgi:hypothetical protein
VLQPLAVAFVVQPCNDVARLTVLGFEFEQQRQNLPLGHVVFIGSFQPFGLVDRSVNWHDAWMTVSRHRPEESLFIWPVVRYAVRAVVSFCIVAFVSLVCWVRLHDPFVYVRVKWPNAVLLMTGPEGIAIGVFTDIDIEHIKWGNDHVSWKPSGGKELSLRANAMDEAVSLQYPDGLVTKRGVLLKVQLTFLVTTFCLAGIFYVILAAFLRRRRRHNPTEPQ